ncbi:ribonuclease [Halobacillus fulvus]|nr:ribonuclease [Halobacillus fulvus]
MRRMIRSGGFLLLILCCIGCTSPSSEVLSVEEAMGMSNGQEVTMEAYIVGVPVQVESVQQRDFTSDYALALAESPDETNINEMIFVQLPSQFRQEFGLETNPERIGEIVTVTGVREDYFSHAGIKQLESIDGQDTETEESTDAETNYYEGVTDLSGDELKQGLNDLIDAHNELSYDDVWEALKELDANPENPDEVLLLYSGRAQPASENGGGVDEWNREHVWPKSRGDFGNRMGAGTDLHHLRPTDTTINSSRGNLAFDNGGEPHQEAQDTYSDSDSWEPRDEVKGDVARMMFYMAVRYEGEREDEPDLELVEDEEADGPVLGVLSTLKEWHKMDPVSDIERERNELIYATYQGNRNPFIDHPEFVEEIW